MPRHHIKSQSKTALAISCQPEQSNASTFVSALYGIAGTCPIGKQIPGNAFTIRRLIEDAKLLREPAFQTSLQGFVIITFEHFHKYLAPSPFMIRKHGAKN